MKKIFRILFFTCLLVFVKEVSAVRPVLFRNEIKSTIQVLKEEVKPTISEIRKQTREAIKLTITASPSAKPWEIRKEIREQNKGLLEEIKNQAKEKLQALRYNAKFTGKITEVGGDYINVSGNSDGKMYQVKITEKTQLRRNFWGSSSLNEFSVGDEVNVIGRYTNDEKTTIEAILIRNKSIQKRWGVFFGEVLSKDGSFLRIKTVNRDELKVYVTNSTKLVNRRDETITFNDIQVGHRIRTKGVWNKELKEIREIEEVKDFSLPALPTKVLIPVTTE